MVEIFSIINNENSKYYKISRLILLISFIFFGQQNTIVKLNAYAALKNNNNKR